MLRKAWMLVVVLLASQLQLSCASYIQQCYTDPDLDSNNTFLYLMNGCLRVNSTIMDSINHQISSTFNVRIIILYLCDSNQRYQTPLYFNILLCFALFIPLLLYFKNMKMEIVTRYSQLQLQALMLLLNLATVFSMQSWLQAIIQQPSPCLCLNRDDIVYRRLGGTWGMPSAESLTTSLMALSLSQQFNFLPGLIMFILLPLFSVLAGYNSIGQVLTAIGLAVCFYIYFLKSPLRMRIFDLIFNIVVACVIFPIIQSFYHVNDISFIFEFIEGIIWQVSVFAILFLCYNKSFINDLFFKYKLSFSKFALSNTSDYIADTMKPYSGMSVTPTHIYTTSSTPTITQTSIPIQPQSFRLDRTLSTASTNTNASTSLPKINTNMDNMNTNTIIYSNQSSPINNTNVNINNMFMNANNTSTNYQSGSSVEDTYTNANIISNKLRRQASICSTSSDGSTTTTNLTTNNNNNSFTNISSSVNIAGNNPNMYSNAVLSPEKNDTIKPLLAGRPSLLSRHHNSKWAATGVIVVMFLVITGLRTVRHWYLSLI